MMHGDAHPGSFMLREDGKLVVNDFGAVAPLPDGLPIEMGQMIRLARDRNYEELLPTMEKVGFIPARRTAVAGGHRRDARPVRRAVEVPVFHYTRKWLQRHAAAANMERARPSS